MTHAAPYLATVLVHGCGESNEALLCSVGVSLVRQPSDQVADSHDSDDVILSPESEESLIAAWLEHTSEHPMMFTVGETLLLAVLRRMMARGASCRIDLGAGQAPQKTLPLLTDALELKPAFQRVKAFLGGRAEFPDGPYPVKVWLLPLQTVFATNELVSSCLDSPQDPELWQAVIQQGVTVIDIEPDYFDVMTSPIHLQSVCDDLRASLTDASLPSEWHRM